MKSDINTKPKLAKERNADRGSSAAPGATSSEINIPFQKGDWLTLPLAAIALLCGYHIISNWQGPLSVLPSLSGWSVLTAPTWAALLLAVFSVLYIYKIMKRQHRPIIARIVAYALSLLLLIVAFFAFKQSGSCSFAGGSIPCGTAQYLLFWIIFFNPYVTPFLVILSSVSIFSLLIPSKRPQSSRSKSHL